MIAHSLVRLASAGIAVVLFAGLASGTGCARVPAAPAAATPPDLDHATAQARCAVRHSADKPLVVEWPAADRAALEARARRGLVPVRYEGCTMEVLSGCELPDSRYEFIALSPKQERVSIRSADELYARLPVGAAALEGKLERSGELVVELSIVGRQQADRDVVEHDELRGRCDGATHVLTGLTVGAFTLQSGGATAVGVEARVGTAGAGGSHERSRELLARDGDPLACAEPALEPGSPPSRWGALLRVEAVPLAGPARAAMEVPTGLAGGGGEPVDPEQQRARERMARRAAAWRGVAITSGVLSGASLGGMVGGSVLMIQGDDHAVWEEPSPESQRRKRIGTGMVVGSAIGFIGFGALALGAGAASRRGSAGPLSWVGPTLSATGMGVELRGRF